MTGRPTRKGARRIIKEGSIVMAEGQFPYGPSRRPWSETVSKIAISATDGKLIVSPPVADPLQLVEAVPGVTDVLYQVTSSGLSREDHDRAMEETRRVICDGSKSFLGFMNNQSFNYAPFFESPLIRVQANNAGDPFTVGTPICFQPKWVERNVLDYYASLWNAKWPHNPGDPDSYWGYVVNMGSTEGIIHAMWSARNYLSGKCIQTFENESGSSKKAFKVVQGNFSTSNPNNKIPVLLYSQNSNCSLSKASDIVNLLPFDVVGDEKYSDENPLGGEWVEGVPCTGGDAGPGTIDIEALEKLVDFFSSKGHPIMVIFNYGNTVKGTCDDIQSAAERLVGVLKKNNMYERKVIDPDNPTAHVMRKGFWFHVDGALSAAYMPFLEMAYKNGLTDVKPASNFDFRLDYISSVVTSGHKYIGTPWPCGIYIMRNGMRLPAQRRIPYSGGFDTTVSLSRNAHSALLLWSYISTNSYNAQVERILSCLQVVTYAVRKLKELEKKIGVDLWITNFSPSLSILFRRPNSHIRFKYTLSVCSLRVDFKDRLYAQIFIMDHVTTSKIDSFIEDLQAPDAFSF